MADDDRDPSQLYEISAPRVDVLNRVVEVRIRPLLEQPADRDPWTMGAIGRPLPHPTFTPTE
jgi:hypothetical protein